MHGFLSLAPVLALALGQTEPAEPAAPPEPPPAQEPAPAAATESPIRAAVEPAPARATPRSAQGADRPPASPPRPAEPERAQVARSALAFLDALLAADASGLAAASSERFSFDGDVRVGRDEVRRGWEAVLSSRGPAQRGALLDLEVLPTADAVARLGAPPARLAPLVAKGTWVAIANVARRPVVLFLAREGGRFAVVGME